MDTTVLPISGFVDLQVNGYKGISFSSPTLTEQDAASACRALLAEGTAAFLPTIITSAPDVYERNLPILATIIGRDEFRGRVLGVHAEGPFVSREPGAVGAHPPELVAEPDVALLNRMIAWARGHIRLLTVAAELPGICDLIARAVSDGIVVSVGHTLADSSDMKSAAGCGIPDSGGLKHCRLPRVDDSVWQHLRGVADCIYRSVVQRSHPGR